jgi:hypothetical protein
MSFRVNAGRRVVALALSGLAAASFTVAPSAPASAADYNGQCESGEVCLWYYTGYNGAMADFYNNVSNYNNWHFYNSIFWLANNTESVKNRARYSCVELYDNANYSGALRLLFSHGESGNLDNARNKTESHRFLGNNFPNACQI